MERIISLIAITITSLLAVWFIVKGNFEVAVLFLTLMFTLTNFTRYRSFQKQGLEKEAKWMRGTTILFSVLFLAVLFLAVL
jgi:hypothetical protein